MLFNPCVPMETYCPSMKWLTLKVSLKLSSQLDTVLQCTREGKGKKGKVMGVERLSADDLLPKPGSRSVLCQPPGFILLLALNL